MPRVAPHSGKHTRTRVGNRENKSENTRKTVGENSGAAEQPSTSFGLLKLGRVQQSAGVHRGSTPSCPPQTHTHTHTHARARARAIRAANKNRARNGAAGQPETSFRPLMENDKVQSWTAGSVRYRIPPVRSPAPRFSSALTTRPKENHAEEFVFMTAQKMQLVLGATNALTHTHA